MTSKAKKFFIGLSLAIIIAISLFSSNQFNFFQGRTALTMIPSNSQTDTSTNNTQYPNCPNLKIAEYAIKGIEYNKTTKHSYGVLPPSRTPNFAKREDRTALKILFDQYKFKIPSTSLFYSSGYNTSEINDILIYNHCPSFTKQIDLNYDYPDEIEHYSLIQDQETIPTFKISSNEYFEGTKLADNYRSTSAQMFIFKTNSSSNYLDAPIIRSLTPKLNKEDAQLSSTSGHLYKSKHLEFQLPHLASGDYQVVLAIDGINYEPQALHVKGDTIDICKTLVGDPNASTSTTPGFLDILINKNTELNNLELDKLSTYDFSYIDNIADFVNNHSYQYDDGLQSLQRSFNANIDPHYKKAYSFYFMNTLLKQSEDTKCNFDITKLNKIRNSILKIEDVTLKPTLKFEGELSDYHYLRHTLKTLNQENLLSTNNILWYDDPLNRITQHDKFIPYQFLKFYDQSTLELKPNQETDLQNYLSEVGASQEETTDYLTYLQAINTLRDTYTTEEVSTWQPFRYAHDDVLDIITGFNDTDGYYYTSITQNNINSLLNITPFRLLSSINISLFKQYTDQNIFQSYILPFYSSYLAQQNDFILINTLYYLRADINQTITVQAVQNYVPNNNFNQKVHVLGLDDLNFEKDIQFTNGKATFTVNLPDNFHINTFHLTTNDQDGFIGVYTVDQKYFSKANEVLNPTKCSLTTSEEQSNIFSNNPLEFYYNCTNNITNLSLDLISVATDTPIQQIFTCHELKTCQRSPLLIELDNYNLNPNDTYYFQATFNKNIVKQTKSFKVNKQIPVLHSFFPDVDPAHPYSNAINWMAEAGYIKGFQDGTFGPNKPVTRAELVKMVAEATHQTKPLALIQIFPDVHQNDWFYTYVNNASSRNWVHGYQDGSFGPNRSVSRAEAIKIAIGANSIPVNHYEAGHQFIDMAGNDWFFNYIMTAYQQNLVGTLHIKDTHNQNSPLSLYFYPNQNMTRAEVAEMLFRMSAHKKPIPKINLQAPPETIVH